MMAVILIAYLIGAAIMIGVVLWIGNENLGTYGSSASELSLIITMWPLVVLILVYFALSDWMTNDPA